MTSPEENAPETDEGDETIPVELGGVTRFIPRSEIRWVQAQGDYARLHTPSGSHLVRIPLADLVPAGILLALSLAFFVGAGPVWDIATRAVQDLVDVGPYVEAVMSR